MSPSNPKRRPLLIASTTLAAAMAVTSWLAIGGVASAKLASSSSTLHLFAKSQSNLTYQPNGQPVADQNAAPSVGDYFAPTDIDYPGTAKNHGSTSTGADHLVCKLTQVGDTSAQAVCDGVIVYKGSLVYVDQQTVTVGPTSPIQLPISGGTGQFHGAHGTVTATPVTNSNNTNITIAYSK
jgi:hypothetical protein